MALVFQNLNVTVRSGAGYTPSKRKKSPGPPSLVSPTPQPSPVSTPRPSPAPSTPQQSTAPSALDLTSSPPETSTAIETQDQPAGTQAVPEENHSPDCNCTDCLTQILKDAGAIVTSTPRPVPAPKTEVKKKNLFPNSSSCNPTAPYLTSQLPPWPPDLECGYQPDPRARGILSSPPRIKKPPALCIELLFHFNLRRSILRTNVVVIYAELLILK
ncbi:serine/threonine-protein kinase C-like [Palaemon carinicauda]|uniref:serine/threonine-protein kinase C-like n=1 Tax=Palaemon carinicauda TaxID=392227 RepID=UPI0035B61B05